MSDGSLPEVFAAQVLFWVLLPVTLFAPLRWAILAWLVMGNLDATGPDQSAQAVIGWINAVKGLVLPLYLYWRLRRTKTEVTKTLSARLWIALICYALIAILWTPFPLAGVKLVGNMCGVLLSVIVLEKAARNQMLTARTFVLLICISLLLGIVQTYYYGGVGFGFDGIDQASRFSSFVAAQQYAAYLVCFLAITLWFRDLKGATRVVLSMALLTALFLNGSRVWFLGAIFVLIIFSWLSFRRVFGVVAFASASAALFLMFILNVTTLDGLALDSSPNRIVATISALATGVDTGHDLGMRDFSFRTAVYQGVMGDLRAGKATQILFGHGTSSGADVLLRVFPQNYKIDHLDANRAIHNEWLRAFYEWGVIGLFFIVGVFATLLAGLFRQSQMRRLNLGRAAALSFVPAFLAAFSGENILAGAGNAVTMSLAIILALPWIAQRQSSIR